MNEDKVNAAYNDEVKLVDLSFVDLMPAKDWEDTPEGLYLRDMIASKLKEIADEC